MACMYSMASHWTFLGEFDLPSYYCGASATNWPAGLARFALAYPCPYATPTPRGAEAHLHYKFGLLYMAESELSDIDTAICHFCRAQGTFEELRNDNPPHPARHSICDEGWYEDGVMWAKATEGLIYCLRDIAQAHENAEQVDKALQSYDSATQLIAEAEAQGYKHKGSSWEGCLVRHNALKQMQQREPHRFPEWAAAQVQAGQATAGQAVLQAELPALIS